jgi:hypothetical protein
LCSDSCSLATACKVVWLCNPSSRRMCSPKDWLSGFSHLFQMNSFSVAHPCATVPETFVTPGICSHSTCSLVQPAIQGQSGDISHISNSKAVHEQPGIERGHPETRGKLPADAFLCKPDPASGSIQFLAAGLLRTSRRQRNLWAHEQGNTPENLEKRAWEAVAR